VTEVPLLTVSGLTVTYGRSVAVRDVSFEVPRGSLVCFAGANGAGKSSIMRSISGLVPGARGEIVFDGHSLLGMRPHRITQLGVAMVPEGRRVLSSMTVRENLELGAVTRRDAAGIEEDLESALDRFPQLRPLQRRQAGALSGGEQQMLAVARALMSRPRLLLCDELSLGLAPKVVTLLLEMLGELVRGGLTVVLAEQNVRQAMRRADSAVVLSTGSVVAAGPAAEIGTAEVLQVAYLGSGSDAGEH
jgi:branched-chain amino acid transport system ATP-binding protein